MVEAIGTQQEERELSLNTQIIKRDLWYTKIKMKGNCTQLLMP